jgi:eukaryotic-like serine/threonine-protein kinase
LRYALGVAHRVSRGTSRADKQYVTSSFFPPATESDGARYELGRILGTGSAGTVYLAVDRDTGEQVALKKLIRFDTKSVMRLKREFRSLANMHHPNLVKLYDLGRSGDSWFLTMEYLEGVDLLAYLGVGTDPLATNQGGYQMPPISRVMSTFHQLARGVNALHQAKLLHRDLKPTNVMVTAGRVVALDFGLACALEEEESLVTHDGSIAGTPAYMPPEQALGQTLSEVSDWYAVGVMLYQVLSGQLPIDGKNANELLRRKLERDPTPLSRLNPEVPAPLEALCMRLLSREPEARPSGEEVLEVLGEYEPDPLQLEVHSMQTELGIRTDSQVRTGSVRLFGRDDALNSLQGALDQAEKGEPVVVHVRGASGTGKTALVECFLQRVTEDSSGLGFVETLVLRSRCYEREAMPFKALDGVIDALVRYLSTLDDIDVAHVLPEYVAELAQLFPALDRLRAVQRLAANARPRNDSAQVRTRAEQALRELFMRLASRRTLVLWIDDLQWGDLDSASLLEGWLPLVKDASILFVFSYRSEELQTSSCLKLLLDSSKRHPELAPKQIIELAPLTDADMERLCEERMRKSGAATPELVRRIVQEARGNPFLASQLTALAQARLESPEPAAIGALSLEALVAESTALLSPPARAVLNVLAIGGRPVSSPIALRTAGVSRDGNAHLHALKSLRLIRTREVSGERRIEVYHDRVRESVCSALSDEERVRIYDRLLREVEVSGNMDVDWMHSLALGAGQTVPALRYGLIAAERASTALAFERAADLYQVCLKLTEADAVSGELWHKYALALARCRRGRQAAHAYLQAAERAKEPEALPLIRLAAMHLLRSGEFERGESLVDKVLAAHDESVPASDGGIVAALAWERGRLALRAGRYTARVEAAVPGELRERVDLFATLTVDTIAYDPLRAALFQARCMRLALLAGDPTSVARAYCLAATLDCVTGTERAAQRSATLLAHADELCKSQPSLRLQRYVHVARAVCAALLGHPEQALTPSEEAMRLYREDTRGDEHGEYYHSFTAIAVRISALAALGDYAAFTSELQDCLERARVTENNSMLLHLSAHHTLAEQLAGQPHLSIARLDREREILPSKRFGVLHAMHMCGVMMAANATSEFEWAHKLVDAWWPRYVKSVVHRSAYLGILAHTEHARMLLNERVARGELRDLGKLLAADLKALDGSALQQHAVGAAQALRARVAYLHGEHDHAIALLREAVAAFDEAGLRADAAVTRHGLGRVLQEQAARYAAEGAQINQLAESQLAKCGVRNAHDFCARHFPELIRAASGTRSTIAAEVRETG